MLKKDNRTGPTGEDLASRRLVQRIAKNLDREAFANLFDAFAPRVKSFMIRKGASPDLAEDLVQETMINVWTKAGMYDPAKGTVLTWVFTIARNLRIDRIRRESSRPYLNWEISMRHRTLPEVKKFLHERMRPGVLPAPWPGFHRSKGRFLCSPLLTMCRKVKLPGA